MKKYRVNVNGTDYEIALEVMSEEEAKASAPAAPSTPAPAAAPVAAPATPAPAAAPVVAPTGGEKINAPMPGTILDIKVANGSTVKRGDILMILEAMKMENEIISPVDGTVTVITTKGSMVKTGELLCTIE